MGAQRCGPAKRRHCPALPCRSFFKINRDTPEAKANQIEWARKQMDLEVPRVRVRVRVGVRRVRDPPAATLGFALAPSPPLTLTGRRDGQP